MDTGETNNSYLSPWDVPTVVPQPQLGAFRFDVNVRGFAGLEDQHVDKNRRGQEKDIATLESTYS